MNQMIAVEKQQKLNSKLYFEFECMLLVNATMCILLSTVTNSFLFNLKMQIIVKKPFCAVVSMPNFAQIVHNKLRIWRTPSFHIHRRVCGRACLMGPIKTSKYWRVRASKFDCHWNVFRAAAFSVLYRQQRRGAGTHCRRFTYAKTVGRQREWLLMKWTRLKSCCAHAAVK